jgi:5-methylcytosine-specific restriction endonuclease McrA
MAHNVYRNMLSYADAIALAERCLGIERCPLCRRDLDETSEKHHLVPKSRGGKATERLHKICHRKVHATFSEKELEKQYSNVEALLSHEDIQKFVEWVKDKPPSFYDGSNETKRRKSLRKK